VFGAVGGIERIFLFLMIAPDEIKSDDNCLKNDWVLDEDFAVNLKTSFFPPQN
jgi:hypothetical protein